MFSSLSKKLWEVIKSLRQDTSGGKYIKPTVAPPSSLFLHTSCKCSSSKGVILPDQSACAGLGHKAKLLLAINCTINGGTQLCKAFMSKKNRFTAQLKM